MILSAAIDAFFERELDDHRYLKKLPPAEIDARLKKIAPDFKPNPILRHHQKVCLYLGIKYPRFSFFVDLGLGKTLLTLELLRYWWSQDAFRVVIIEVKSDKAFPTWEKQIKQYGIKIPVITLEGSSKEKWERLNSFNEGIVLVARAGFVRMATENKGNKLKLSKKLLARLKKKVDGLVLDESTDEGRKSSLMHRIAWNVSKDASIVYALAARHSGRNPEMLWAQQRIVDRGVSLGPTLGLFRAAFYTETEKKIRGYEIKEYKLRHGALPEIRRMMQHRSITYREYECNDVPKYVPIIEEVLLPEETRAYYDKQRRRLKDAAGDKDVVEDTFIRMRQLSSGFLGWKNDQTGERVEIEMTENPKLDRLLDLLEDLPEDRSAVVFYEFTYSGRRIYEEVKKLKLKPIWLWSGTKDVRGDLIRFEEGRSRVAIINHRVGAYSIDGLQVANYTFFYETPVAVIAREQAAARVRRQGQKRKVFETDLIVRGTNDQRILDFHKEGRDIFNELARNPGKF